VHIRSPGRAPPAGARLPQACAFPRCRDLIPRDPVSGIKSFVPAQRADLRVCIGVQRRPCEFVAGFWPVGSNPRENEAGPELRFRRSGPVFFVAGAGFEPATSGRDRALRRGLEDRRSPRVYAERPRGPLRSVTEPDGSWRTVSGSFVAALRIPLRGMNWRHHRQVGAAPAPDLGNHFTRPHVPSHGTPLSQEAAGSTGLGCLVAGPGSGFSEEPALGCEPVALESESCPVCPPGPVTA
jgi:hypothetical protein